MQIKTIVCGPLDVNSYVFWREGKGTAAVIDPADTAPVLSFLQENGLHCTHILLTHGHFDHIGGVADLARITGAKVCIHADDAQMLYDDKASLAILQELMLPPVHADVLFDDRDALDIPDFDAYVLHTPGHTPGSVCYVFEKERIIFTGDTIFRMGAGRADFPGSDEVALFHSIADKLFLLEGDYTLYPGHMRETTLEFERVRNTYIRRCRRLGW